MQATAYHFRREGKRYIGVAASRCDIPMLIERLTTGVLYAAYQSSLLLGIVLLPLALAARRLGVTLPIHRLVERTKHAYRAR